MYCYIILTVVVIEVQTKDQTQEAHTKACDHCWLGNFVLILFQKGQSKNKIKEQNSKALRITDKNSEKAVYNVDIQSHTIIHHLRRYL